MAIFFTLVALVILISNQLTKDDVSNSSFYAKCLEQVEFNNLNSIYCKKLMRQFPILQSSKDVLAVTAEQIKGAVSLPIDDEVTILLTLNPDFLAHLSYCYFQFRGWFDPKELGPSDLSRVASGLAILREELDGYDNWLGSKDGVKCQERVESNVMIHDPLKFSFNDIFEHSAALIAINPLVEIQSGRSVEEVIKQMALTLNHERIHILQALCPELDKYAHHLWENLSSNEKERVIENYPVYDWSNPLIAAREYLALKYENDLDSLRPLFTTCF